MFNPHPFFLQRRKVVIKFVGSELLATDLTTYTFTSITLPPPCANHKRVIVAAFHGEDAATAYSISSATFNGVSMTSRAASSATPTSKVAFFSLADDSIVSGSAAVTFSEAVTSAGYGLWCVYGINEPVYTSVDGGASTFTGARNHGNGGFPGDAWFWAGTSVEASPSGVITHTGTHSYKATGDYNDLGAEMSTAGTSWIQGQYGQVQRIDESFDFSGTGACVDVLFRIRELSLAA